MGLLSGMETSRRQKIFQKLTKNEWWIGSLMYVLGVGLFVALAHDSLSARLFVDENALLPGIASERFSGGNEAQTMAGEWETFSTRDQLVEWLTTKLTTIGIEVYTQNFSAPLPFPETHQHQTISGVNVYGILRAPRGASVESIVLSSPYRLFTHTSDVQPSHYGVALLISLANYFRHLNYWSKDLIFLFYSDELVGMQAWTEAYMGTKLSNIQFSQLTGRSGNIDSAINIDMPSAQFKAIDLDMAGINGMLPNYDIYSMSWKIASNYKRMIPTGPFGEGARYPTDFVQNALTMLRTVSAQAIGIPSAGHGLLVRHRVDALTVRALPSAPYVNVKRFGLQDMGKVISMIVRSLNNLLEHLHHSFYFYVLPNANHYVSVSLYTPPLALILSGTILKAVSIWVVTGLKRDSNGVPCQGQFAFGEVQRNIRLILPAFLCSQLAGVLVYVAPAVGVMCMASLSGADGALIALAVAGVGSVVVVPLVIRKFSSTTDPHNSQWAILHCFALVIQLLTLTGLSMMNFGLGLFFAVTAVIPTRLLTQQTNQSCRANRHSIRWFLQLFFVTLASPPVTLWFGCLLHCLLNGQSSSLSFMLYFTETSGTFRDGVLAALRHQQLTGMWTYAAVTLVLWPNWLLFWTTLWQSPVDIKHDVTKMKKEQ